MPRYAVVRAGQVSWAVRDTLLGYNTAPFTDEREAERYATRLNGFANRARKPRPAKTDKPAPAPRRRRTYAQTKRDQQPRRPDPNDPFA